MAEMVKKMAILNYKPEIDGLRAFAVLFVIIFHMNEKWLPSGFIGVDIFFVISGYLITTIILKQLNTNTFSLADFYARRIKRILPVLYVVLIVSIIVGYVLFRPVDIKYLNESLNSILIFLGNNFFAKKGSYFSLQANETPLLHTWSLAVEEQFYFLWPAIIIGLFRYKRNILIASLCLMIASFLISEYLFFKQGFISFAYYSLITRAGELLAGSVTAILTIEGDKSRSKFIELYGAYLGIIIITLCLSLITKASSFPGLNAFYICLGTALVIYGIDQRNNLVYSLLRWRFFTLIGKISYSLYLWHWPILAYMRYVYGSYELPLTWLVIAFALTFVFSVISYLFVENKVRHLKLNFKSSFLAFYVVPSFIVLVSITALNKTSLMAEENLEPIYIKYGGTELCHGKITGTCIRGDKSKKPKTLVVGDSHTAHYNYFFQELGQRCGWSVRVVSSNSCSPVLDYNELLLPKSAHKKCQNLKDYFWKHYTDYEVIILSSRWDFQLGLSDTEGNDPLFFKKLEASLDLLSKKVKHIYVLSQIPLLSNNPFRIKKFLNLGLPIGIKVHSSNSEIANLKVKKLTEKYPNVTWVDITTLFQFFDRGFLFGGNPIYMDNTHLNQYGAQILATLFLDHTPHHSIFPQIRGSRKKCP